ncbi:hypothetical protein MMPV_009041 [Pyropia vietnamensis]
MDSDRPTGRPLSSTGGGHHPRGTPYRASAHHRSSSSLGSGGGELPTSTPRAGPSPPAPSRLAVGPPALPSQTPPSASATPAGALPALPPLAVSAHPPPMRPSGGRSLALPGRPTGSGASGAGGLAAFSAGAAVRGAAGGSGGGSGSGSGGGSGGGSGAGRGGSGGHAGGGPRPRRTGAHSASPGHGTILDAVLPPGSLVRISGNNRTKLYVGLCPLLSDGCFL